MHLNCPYIPQGFRSPLFPHQVHLAALFSLLPFLCSFPTSCTVKSLSLAGCPASAQRSPRRSPLLPILCSSPPRPTWNFCVHFSSELWTPPPPTPQIFFFHSFSQSYRRMHAVPRLLIAIQPPPHSLQPAQYFHFVNGVPNVMHHLL